MKNTFLIFLIFIASFLSAQNNTWTPSGAGETDWHKTCNWSLGAIPTASHDVYIPNSGSYPIITGNAHCSELFITSTANNTLTINSSGSGNLCISSTNSGSCSSTLTDNGGCAGLIPNGSFEDMNCCPTNANQNHTGGPIDCLNDWEGTFGSPDYFNCGYTQGTVPMPIPDGTGYIGFAYIQQTFIGPSHEHFGICLTSALSSGTNYTFQFEMAGAASVGATYQNVQINLYGTTNCGSGSPPSTGMCSPPGANYVLLGSSAPILADNSSWKTGTINFTAPSNITGIAITPNINCSPTPAVVGYLYMDNVSIN